MEEKLKEKIESTKKDIENKRNSLTKASNRRLMDVLALGLSIAGALVFLIIGLSQEENFQRILFIVSAIFFFPLVVYFVLRLIVINSKAREIGKELVDLEDELDLLKFEYGGNIKRSEELFRNNQKELQRYYKINLGHYRAMFPVGVITIFVGQR